jgi:ABC-type antimicrobial peptide transport system permease subunit
MLKSIRVFALIAICIGCLGLYGLVSFMAVKRVKEIGIRKVLGASFGQILYSFSNRFFLLTLFAFVISAPLAYLAMKAVVEQLCLCHFTELGSVRDRFAHHCCADCDHSGLYLHAGGKKKSFRHASNGVSKSNRRRAPHRDTFISSLFILRSSRTKSGYRQSGPKVEK